MMNMASGGMIGGVATAPFNQTVQQQVQQPQAGAKFCSNCGSPVNGGKFCSNCGQQL